MTIGQTHVRSNLNFSNLVARRGYTWLEIEDLGKDLKANEVDSKKCKRKRSKIKALYKVSLCVKIGDHLRGTLYVECCIRSKD